MEISEKIAINASKASIWKTITDFENAKQNISGIDAIEILNKPNQGLIGLKWKETRTIFGKSADEIMWITEAEENSHYKTRAENHGAVYISTLTIIEEEGQNYLLMGFKGEAQTFFAKIMSALMAPLMKKSTIKLVRQDLEDIKKIVERGENHG